MLGAVTPAMNRRATLTLPLRGSAIGQPSNQLATEQATVSIYA